MHREVTFVDVRQPGIPECISHQPASVNSRGENPRNIKILLLLLLGYFVVILEM